jgi:hypothetical protein
MRHGVRAHRQRQLQVARGVRSARIRRALASALPFTIDATHHRVKGIGATRSTRTLHRGQSVRTRAPAVTSASTRPHQGHLTRIKSWGRSALATDAPPSPIGDRHDAHLRPTASASRRMTACPGAGQISSPFIRTIGTVSPTQAEPARPSFTQAHRMQPVSL